MSVLLEDYCRQSDSKVAGLLQKCYDKAIFIGSDEITFRQNECDCTIQVYVQHSLSCYELLKMHDIFDGLYWRILTSFKGSGYDLCIDVTPDML